MLRDISGSLCFHQPDCFACRGQERQTTPLLMAVSSGRNRIRLDTFVNIETGSATKAVMTLVFVYPFRSVAPFSHPIPSIGWRSCLRTQI